jgi:hypothetical protein
VRDVSELFANVNAAAARTVVGNHFSYFDAMFGEPLTGPGAESSGGLLLLVGDDLGVVETTVIVDGGVDGAIAIAIAIATCARGGVEGDAGQLFAGRCDVVPRSSGRD